MNARPRTFARFLTLIILIGAHFTSGAEFPTATLELAFFPTENGEPVPGGTAFTRNYTLNGPVDGGRLLPGMLLQPGPRFFYGTRPDAVYQYNPDTQSLQAMNTSGIIPPLSWPMGITHDTRLGRMVLVSLGGEGILYNYVVPDPTNAPATGLWTFLGSMENKDVDSIAYLASRDTFYALGFSYGPGMPAVIFRIGPDGTHLGHIPLPELPYDIGLNGYEGELIAYGEYLVLFLEPRAGNNPLIQESRIYLINPATYEVHLVYQRALDAGTPDTTGPDIDMLSPANNTIVNLGTPILLRALATDTGGVQRVEFHNNGSLLSLASLNSGTSNLYSLLWSNAPVGTNRIVARAVDNTGNIGASAAINLVVVTTNAPPGTNQPDTTPPTVQIRTPSNGARVEQGGLIVLSARAVDNSGTVQLVEFLRNGVLLARGANSRAQQEIFVYSWSNAPLGTNIIVARATDTAGLVGTSAPISIVVVSNNVPVPTNRPPVVRLTFPDQNAVFPISAIRLTASASDPDGSIAKVDFFVDGTLLGTRVPTNGGSTFFFEWTPPTNGTYELSARATDNLGLAANSAAVRVRIGEPVQNDRISAERSLPDEFRPGHPFEVKIRVEAGRNVESWSVQDQPPAGWRVVGISHGGKFDSATGLVKFGPFNKNDRTLRYHLISSKTNVGTFHFTGQVIADGVISDITGDDSTVADPPRRKIKVGKGKSGKWIFVIDPDDDDRRWVVEYRDSLTRGEWIALPIATITVSETGEISINDPDPTRGQRFYRLRFLDDADDDDDDDDDDD
jgi:hypothetical protein